MIRDEIKYWAGAIASAAGAVAALGILSHPYDKIALAVSVAAMAISMYQVTPNRLR